MTGMHARVGIVVPVYNRPARLVETLRAIAGQTYPHFRCVVADDASTDGTVAAARQFCARDPRFEIVLLPRRGGPGPARNAGTAHVLAAASGQPSVAWLAFCDSDDIWLPDKLAVQLEILDRGGGDVCHSEEIWIRNGVRVNPGAKHAKPEGRIYAACLPLCAVSPSAIILRRQAWDAVGGFDPLCFVCEDYDLWLRLFARYPAALSKTPLVVKHGGHADQLSTRTAGMDRFRLYALMKSWRNDRPLLSETERALLTRWIIRRARILNQGFAKRGKDARADFYRRIEDCFALTAEERAGKGGGGGPSDNCVEIFEKQLRAEMAEMLGREDDAGKARAFCKSRST